MRKTILYLLKFCIAFLLALIILSGFSLFYYNPPIAVPQKDLYTNHRFEANSFWSNMTEGAGWGRSNNIGYLDRSDYQPGLPTVAFLGSSQVEAQQVPQDKNFVSLSNDLFCSDNNPLNDYQCLNLGVSGHFLNISASNFEYFCENFEGIDYVVLEVSDLYYNKEQIDAILKGKYHSDLGTRNALYQVAQRIPYFRLFAKQLQDLNSGKVTSAPAETAPVDYDAYQEGMNQIISKLAKTAEKHNIQLIILYHHPLQLNPDNTAQTGNDPKIETLFTECCKANNVPLINMNQVMIEHFEKTYVPPYGFANTQPGEGHLNTVGHELIAQEVYREINRHTEGK